MSFLIPTAVRPALGVCGTYLAVGSSNADKALSGITQVLLVETSPEPISWYMRGRGGGVYSLFIYTILRKDKMKNAASLWKTKL